MNAAQLDLPLSEAPVPKIEPGEVEALEAYLLKAGNWTKAKDFPAPWNERRLRAVANASKGRIISGQRGYLATRLGTKEEVQRAAAWLRHQAAQMEHRAAEIDSAHLSRGDANAPGLP